MEKVTFKQAMVPIYGFLAILIYGMLIQPKILHQGSWPIEICFFLGCLFSAGYTLIFLKGEFDELIEQMVEKIKSVMPAYFILLTIGFTLGAWAVSGTMGMVLYYGMKLINADAIYIVGFIVPIIFSLLTGTSWGSAGSIGIIIMAIGGVVGANIPILAGAVVGGCYFGDKMSPISDTTNVAAIAARVGLIDHVKSMAVSTLPAAFVCCIIYLIIGFGMEIGNADISEHIDSNLMTLEQLFDFNILLLLPILIVFIGAFKKYPTVAVLAISMIVSIILGVIFQDYTLAEIMDATVYGFNAQSMNGAELILPYDNVFFNIVNRGGLNSMITPVITGILAVSFIGTLHYVNATELLVSRIIKGAKTAKSTVFSSQLSVLILNSLAGYSTHYLVGDTFCDKYDEVNVDRTVLSRTMEDFGTMMDPMLPWHASAIYMASILGVTVGQLAAFNFLALINVGFALLGTFTGILIKKHIKKLDKRTSHEKLRLQKHHRQK